jgi:hypothetical protein
MCVVNILLLSLEVILKKVVLARYEQQEIQVVV